MRTLLVVAVWVVVVVGVVALIAWFGPRTSKWLSNGDDD